MPKLHLKRTPEEEAAHQWRKKQKKEARGKHRHDSSVNNESESFHKRQRSSPTADYDQKWNDEGDEMEYGPHPPTAGSSSSPLSNPALANAYQYKPDYEAIRAELEEQRFREKICGAFEDDERLDALEARLNNFAHVPGRWRTGGASTKMGGSGRVYDDDGDGDDVILKADPRYMDDEEYAEWIRAGMYRKTHAEEHAEQQRKKALKASHRAQEKALKAETLRLERAAEDERRRKIQEKENRRWDHARERYDRRWKELLPVGGVEDHGKGDLPAAGGFSFCDIPWPVLAAHTQKPDKREGTRRGAMENVRATLSVTVEDLTTEAISMFLLPRSTSTSAKPVPPLGDQEKRERKEKLRETFLRFHPDKFEGRIMKRVKEADKDKVREAIGQVVRVLNTLIGEKA